MSCPCLRQAVTWMFMSKYLTVFHIDFIGICIYLECKGWYVGIYMRVCLVSFQNFLDFFLISNFRGLVPAPTISSLRYFTALELRRSFEFCEDYFKTPFGPPEKRWVEFCWLESVVFCWLVTIVALSPPFQRSPETGKQSPTSDVEFEWGRSWLSREDPGI